VVASGLTVITAVVAPFDHNIEPAHPEAVNVADSPLQIVVEEASTVGAATFVTVTVTELEAPLVQSPFLQTAV
jgi:hypothetical protein